MPLTKSQKDDFEENGFLVVEDAVDREKCDNALETIWTTIPESRDNQVNGDGKESRFLLREGIELGLTDTQPFETLLRDVYPYAEALIGEGKLGSPEWEPDIPCLHAGQIAEKTDWIPEHEGMFEPVLRYPQSGEEWEPNTPHVDGATGEMAYDTDYLPFSIGLTLYIDRVDPGGGGFTVWPGSHKTMNSYFEDHSYSDYLEDPERIQELELGSPVEIARDQGALVLWHPALVHAGSLNCSDRIRMVGLQRLYRKDAVDKDTEGILTNMWSHYDGINSK
jgi:hypothetical protein